MSPQNSTNKPPEDDLARRIRFLDITGTDLDRIRELDEVFNECADDFVSAFYGHLFEEDATATFLQDPELVETLKTKQKEFFMTMLHAKFDGSYSQRRREVGAAHARCGLEPQWFLGAFSMYVQFMFPRFAPPNSKIEAENQQKLMSLLKVILLDIGLTLDAYFSHSTDQLYQALQMLQESNAGLKEFAHLVSHDLKTPIGTVAALCEEFLDEFGDSVPEHAAGLIDSAHKRAMSLARMIEELLSASEAAARNDQATRVSTRIILDDALDRLREVIVRSGAQVEVPENVPAVFANPVRLREVFYNLISNAVKFVAPKDGIVKVGFEERDHDILFSVEDNGSGIPDHELEKIFAPFHRLTIHRSKPGSGLGLHFVKILVEQSQGKTWAESELGRGSTFYFSMPKP